MNVDHIVVHVDNDERILNDLKKETEHAGVPFEPRWGKGTKGFKASNIWIGRQYFEIIQLLTPDGGGWEERWVASYNQGKRGAFCLFLQTNDIRSVATRLRSQGLAIEGPKRLSFKGFFGLIKKTLPWELIYLPPIPGTDLEIGFIQYDPDPKDRIKQFLIPNADENGITGIPSADISLPLSVESRQFIKKLFLDSIDAGGGEMYVPLNHGYLRFQDADIVKINLNAETQKPELKGKLFTLTNVSLTM